MSAPEFDLATLRSPSRAAAYMGLSQACLRGLRFQFAELRKRISPVCLLRRFDGGLRALCKRGLYWSFYWSRTSSLSLSQMVFLEGERKQQQQQWGSRDSSQLSSPSWRLGIFAITLASGRLSTPTVGCTRRPTHAVRTSARDGLMISKLPVAFVL
jgi:hypothetical protein